MDSNELLSIYKSLWNSRNIENVNDSEVVLQELVKRELLDELTHPRVRKTPYEKFYLAVTRISDAPIENEEKIALITRIREVMEEVVGK